MRLASALLAAALALPLPAPASTPDAAALFADQCGDCHTLETGRNKRGPSLAGLIGRQAGSVPGYNYSDAMRRSGVTWTPQRLAQYLAAPKTDLPGTKMRLLIAPNPAQISELIDWLEKQPR
ncbi:c-type cytochrome [Uliginosibacterium paludis]|uniref:C-type cytochrome n=1 Tax=Uliginosibacterium paludis TaxID=1615952 RepID=A0ABV2CTP4_9RHOO